MTRLLLPPWFFLAAGILGVAYGMWWARRPEGEASWIGAGIAPASLILLFAGLLGVLIPGFLGR